MKFANMPVVVVGDDLTEEQYLSLRQMSYGSDGPPDGGFSFLVSSGYLISTIEDILTDGEEPPLYMQTILAQLPVLNGEDVLFMVLCEGDQKKIQMNEPKA
jgi:hypothetical protein